MLSRLIGVIAVAACVFCAASVAQSHQVEIAAAVAFTEGPTVDRDGAVYFTEMVSLRIMKLCPNGVLSTYRENSNNANGLLIDPDGRLIACEGAESNRTGVKQTFKPRVTRTDLRSGTMEVLADNYEGKHTEGNLYGSAGLHNLRGTSETLDTQCGVYIISPQGKLLKFIPIPEDFITNNAFGGQDMRTLYVTAGKTLFKVRTDIAGLPR